MKTNEWIEEEVEIDSYDVKDGKLVPEKSKHIQRSMYIDAKPKRVVCSRGKHHWYPVDIHEYIFACQNCKRKVRAFPVTYKFEDGKLTHRDTGVTV
jgi:hypothetical protein